jgi:cytochrome c peroxidase
MAGPRSFDWLGEQGAIIMRCAANHWWIAILQLLLAVHLGIGGHRCASAATPFGRDALLARFDRNQNGQLEDDEKRALRAAFGGIDVPLLPTEPYKYTDLRLPASLKKPQLAKLDNMPADNPLTDHGATLGRVLFYDTRLSANDTVACASCHRQKAAFTDPRTLSVGFKGAHTERNAMSLVNLRFTNLKGERPGFFWDERAATLEAQVLVPIQDRAEMGMELKALEEKLQKLPYYPPLFEAAFGSPRVTSDRVAKAVAQFLRSLVSLDSKFDRAAAKAADSGNKSGDAAGDYADFTPQENLGKSLFLEGAHGTAEFACAMCHVPPTFSMAAAANNGLDRDYKDRGLGRLRAKSKDPFTPSNDGKFKAPSLRNVELTAPYMHDGRFKTLEQVIEHYSDGVHMHPNLGLALPEENQRDGVTGLRLTREQKAALVAFLKTLTDTAFVSHAKYSDPFIRLDR